MKNPFPTLYPADFTDARAAYRPAQNDSKAEAFKAWEQTKRRRLSAGAFGKRMVFCCQLYNEFLDGENVKRARQKQADYPKAHMATWIRQTRWEGYIEEADQRIAAELAAGVKENPTYAGWESQAEKLISELKQPVVDAWFSGISVSIGEQTVIEFPKGFQAKWVATNFSYAIKRAFGCCILTVSGKPAEKFEIGP